MQEIIINKCFGGFSPSHKAIMRYAKLKGITLYYWAEQRTLDIFEVESTDELLKKDSFSMIYYTTVPRDEFEKLSPDEQNKSYFSIDGVPRNDKTLIQVIRELGKEANSKVSELKIIKIPDNIEWEIEEYDGSEWVAEKHKTWH